MKELKDQISSIKKELESALKSATAEDQLEEVRLTFLSRQGRIASLMQRLKELSLEDKKVFGPELNKLKQYAEHAFTTKKDGLLAERIKQAQEQKKDFDVTAHQPNQKRGTLHPYTLITQEIEDIFISMGYEVADGPEVETDYYNFEAMNIAADHPARDMHDTFWLEAPQMLLRTHTSPVQTHEMEKKGAPLAIVAPGRCYRHEATDASHDFVFLQTEGLLVGKDISMAHLFGTMKTALSALFGRDDLKIRIRPSYFPFVEPGVEIDASCPFCIEGCSVCSRSGWIEVVGAGLVHPNVLRCGGIDAENFSGFAFGFGLTRLALLKYGIPDIRLLHSGRLEFLKQF